MKKAKEYACLFAGLLCFLYYFLCGFTVSFRVSILYFWLLAGTVFCALFVLFHFFPSLCKNAVLRFLLRAFYALSGVFLLLFAVFFVKCVSFSAPPSCPDAVVLLGARCYGDDSPDSITALRCRKAAALLEENPNAVCILSGGKVFGEKQAECDAAKECLLALGVAESRMISESTSATTKENILFSFSLLPDGCREVTLVTSSFHAYRAFCEALPEKGAFSLTVAEQESGGVLLPHFYLREFITYFVDTAKGNIQFLS